MTGGLGRGGGLALMVNEKQQVINWCLNRLKHADGDCIHTELAEFENSLLWPFVDMKILAKPTNSNNLHTSPLYTALYRRDCCQS